MNLIDELEKLTKKYYGYVADIEGSSIEAFDLYEIEFGASWKRLSQMK